MTTPVPRSGTLSYLPVLPAVTALVVVLGGSGPVEAQVDIPVELTAGATAGRSEVRVSDPDGDVRTLTGLVAGLEGSASLWRLEASLAYREGTLDVGDSSGPGTDVVSGRATVGFRVLPWMTVEGGPHAITLVSPAGDQHVRSWRLGASVSVPLVPEVVRGFGSFSGTVAGSGIDRGPVRKGGGGVVGVTITLPGLPARAELGYSLDREILPLASSQSVETVFVTIGVMMEE